MQDAWIDLPAGAGTQAKRARQIQDAVVAARPLLEAAWHVRFGRTGLEAHERVRKVIERLVDLRREIVRLRFAAASDASGLLLALVHVMRDRAEVVEELAEQIPSALTRH